MKVEEPGPLQWIKWSPQSCVIFSLKKGAHEIVWSRERIWTPAINHRVAQPAPIIGFSTGILKAGSRQPLPFSLVFPYTVRVYNHNLLPGKKPVSLELFIRCDFDKTPCHITHDTVFLIRTLSDSGISPGRVLEVKLQRWTKYLNNEIFWDKIIVRFQKFGPDILV